MASTENSNVGVEEVGRRRSVAKNNGGSKCFSDAEDRSWHSPYNSNGGRSYEDYRLSDHEIGGVSEPYRSSSVSDCSVEVDLEAGVQETKVHMPNVEKDCRICHLTLESTNSESAAHKVNIVNVISCEL
ncbi:Zinc finger, RING-CH-type [Thalictrum thalictroides]|uniref:Zinc finger, RING-CH-type n=1 Tax=Thalictrum thalictroides TaxID=46969 RepID=A0A7J6X4W2_THATH|nr:Zinc finger, RING-CH-type [Thalictrum thalictroides]